MRVAIVIVIVNHFRSRKFPQKNLQCCSWLRKKLASVAVGDHVNTHLVGEVSYNEHEAESEAGDVSSPLHAATPPHRSRDITPDTNTPKTCPPVSN